MDINTIVAVSNSLSAQLKKVTEMHRNLFATEIKHIDFQMLLGDNFHALEDDLTVLRDDGRACVILGAYPSKAFGLKLNLLYTDDGTTGITFLYNFNELEVYQAIFNAYAKIISNYL